MLLTQILQKIRSAFYTKSEIDTKLSGKSDTSHNHNSAYLGIKAKAESAKSADSVAWANVSGKPTNVSQFTNDSGYITSSGSCNYANSAGSANDPNAVHKSGDETINGSKTFTSQIVGSIDKAEKDLNGNIITSTYATKSEINQIILAKNLTGTDILPGGIVDCENGNGKLQQLYINEKGTFILALPVPSGVWKSTSFIIISPNHSTIFIKIG